VYPYPVSVDAISVDQYNNSGGGLSGGATVRVYTSTNMSDWSQAASSPAYMPAGVRTFNLSIEDRYIMIGLYIHRFAYAWYGYIDGVTFRNCDGCNPVLLEVLDTENRPVTNLDLNDEGWPTPNPLTARVTLTCPLGGSACAYPFGFFIGPNDDARFYMYHKDFAEDDGIYITCHWEDFTGSANSHQGYEIACTRVGEYTLTLQPGEYKTMRWHVWIQPSKAVDLTFTANWGSFTDSRTLQIPLTQIHPLVFIPGFMGTWAPEYGGNLDPIEHTYDNTVAALQKAGYELGPPGSGASLVPFGWDWRFSLWHTGRYALADDVQAILDTAPLTQRPYVNYEQTDIVAHSAGGLVARSYLEDITLPDTPANVRKFVTLATPHRGLPPAYRGWYGGDVHGAFGLEPYKAALLLAGIVKCERESWTELPGTVQILASGDMYNYIQTAMPSAENLLPASDIVPAYLVDYDTDIAFPYNGQPQNTFLDDLNSVGGGWDASRLVGSLIISSSFSSSEDTDIQYGVLPPPEGTSQWQHGIVVLPSEATGPGDGFVPAYSGNIKQVTALAGAGNIYERREDNGSTQRFDHRAIVSDPRMVRQVLFYFSGLQADELFWNVPPPDNSMLSKIISIFSCSPVRILVTDPSGRQAGVDLVTGQTINQIPGAYVSAADDEPQQIIIPGTTAGIYRVNGIGTDTGPYKVGAAYAAADEPDILTQVFTGTAAISQSYEFVFNMPLSLPVYLPVILKNSTGQMMQIAPEIYNGTFNSPIPTPTPTPVTIETLQTALDNYYQQGQIDNAGVYQSLSEKLDKVQQHFNEGKIDKAINKLEAFVHEVEAQRGKHITAEAADQLTTMARQLIIQWQG
jgi:pimeloyl-ACP methyl ester carboxylesterase